MGKKKKKVPKLSEEQYIAYIASIRGDAAAYNTDGEIFVPPEIRRPEKKKDF